MVHSSKEPEWFQHSKSVNSFQIVPGITKLWVFELGWVIIQKSCVLDRGHCTSCRSRRRWSRLVATRSRNWIPFPPTGPYDPPEIGCSSPSRMRSQRWRLRPRTERSCWTSFHCRRRRRCSCWSRRTGRRPNLLTVSKVFKCWWLQTPPLV